MRIKPITPIQMLKMAYDEAANAIEFCNWYTMNRPQLELHEQQLIDIAYQDGAADAIQDPDHISKPGEYYTDNYDRSNKQQPQPENPNNQFSNTEPLTHAQKVAVANQIDNNKQQNKKI